MPTASARDQRTV